MQEDTDLHTPRLMAEEEQRELTYYANDLRIGADPGGHAGHQRDGARRERHLRPLRLGRPSHHRGGTRPRLGGRGQSEAVIGGGTACSASAATLAATPYVSETVRAANGTCAHYDWEGHRTTGAGPDLAWVAAVNVWAACW